MFGIKKGFTLAEVLITLVIIGIIAAITIPAVINTYLENSFISKFKKIFSTINQAKILAETQNGPIQDWDYGEEYSSETATQFWSYLRPHMQITKDCGVATNCFQLKVFALNGSNVGSYNTNTYYKFVTSDGVVVWFRTHTGKCSASYVANDVCAVFMIDLNGDNKPNTLGRDVFQLFMTKNGFSPNTTDDCRKNGEGWGCSAYIIKNSDMKYLH